MAGDWMKMELELPDKPEVHYMARTLNMDPDLVVGKLFRVWAWFDKHTSDGNAVGVTFALVDRVAGVTGFGEAMSFAGWLEQRERVLHMPNFDRHNGKSAKKRALGQQRSVTHRSRQRNADSVTKALPEKRREEVKQGVPPNGGSTVWDFGKSLLAEQGLSTKSAGALIGSWLRDWDEPTVADALRSAAGKADVKAYVIAVLQNKPKKGSAGGEKRVAL